MHEKDSTIIQKVFEDEDAHRGSVFHRILIVASRTETAVATKRNKLQMFTMMAKVHGTTKRRIHAVDYLIDIFCKIFIMLL